MARLKGCPCCRATAQRRIRVFPRAGNDDKNRPCYSIWCGNCGLRTSWKGTMDEAEEWWNLRPEDVPPVCIGEASPLTSADPPPADELEEPAMSGPDVFVRAYAAHVEREILAHIKPKASKAPEDDIAFLRRRLAEVQREQRSLRAEVNHHRSTISELLVALAAGSA